MALHSLAQEFEARFGVKIKPAWYQQTVAALESGQGFATKSGAQKLQLLFGCFLAADMNAIGSGCLPRDLKAWHQRTLEGRFVVQCNEVINAAAPIKDRYKPAGKGRFLKLHLTDGAQSVFGGELQMVPSLEVLAPAGFKIAITNAEIKRGFLLLRPENVVVIGGKVDRLEEDRVRMLEKWASPAGPRYGDVTPLGITRQLSEAAQGGPPARNRHAPRDLAQQPAGGRCLGVAGPENPTRTYQGAGRGEHPPAQHAGPSAAIFRYPQAFQAAAPAAQQHPQGSLVTHQQPPAAPGVPAASVSAAAAVQTADAPTPGNWTDHDPPGWPEDDPPFLGENFAIDAFGPDFGQDDEMASADEDDAPAADEYMLPEASRGEGATAPPAAEVRHHRGFGTAAAGGSTTAAAGRSTTAAAPSTTAQSPPRHQQPGCGQELPAALRREERTTPEQQRRNEASGDSRGRNSGEGRTAAAVIVISSDSEGEKGRADRRRSVRRRQQPEAGNAEGISASSSRSRQHEGDGHLEQMSGQEASGAPTLDSAAANLLEGGGEARDDASGSTDAPAEVPGGTLMDFYNRISRAALGHFPLAMVVSATIRRAASPLKLRKGGTFRYSINVELFDATATCVAALDHGLIESLVGAPPEQLLADMRVGDSSRRQQMAALINGFKGVLQLQMPEKDAEFPVVTNLSADA